MNSNILSILQNKMPTFSKGQRRLAQYIIESYDKAAFLTASVSYEISEDLRHCAARCAVLVGGRERRAMRRSAERLHALLPHSTLEVKPGLYHGEFSLSHPQEYVQLLRELMAADKLENNK